MTPPTIYRTVCDPCGYHVSAMSVEALRDGLQTHQARCHVIVSLVGEPRTVPCGPFK